MAALRESMTRAQFNRVIRASNNKLCKSGADLGNILRDMVAASESRARNIIAKAAAQALTEVADGTPKATGRAANAWQLVTVQSDIEYVPDKSAESIAQAKVRQKATPENLMTTDIIWIVNNVEYIYALEAGWSINLPGGFIARMIQRLSIKLQRETKEFNNAR